jgi:hypothetical protein
MGMGGGGVAARSEARSVIADIACDLGDRRSANLTTDYTASTDLVWDLLGWRLVTRLES